MKPYSNLKLAAGGTSIPEDKPAATPAATPAAKTEDSYSYGQRFGNFARNPTENNTVNYGILGGVGALGAGGLAYLLSSPENRKRNALIFALLGGGAGLAGKYYADRGFATPEDKPAATPAAATPAAATPAAATPAAATPAAATPAAATPTGGVTTTPEEMARNRLWLEQQNESVLQKFQRPGKLIVNGLGSLLEPLNPF